MKNIKIILFSTTIALGITGAVIARTNEKKRLTQATAYFMCGANWHSLTADVSVFDNQGMSYGAYITDEYGFSVSLYTTQNFSYPAKFVCPDN